MSVPTFSALRYQIPAMLDHGGGAIVNMNSVAALSTFAGYCPYSAAKWGIVGITRVAAREYAGSNIRVNAVAPGAIDTPLFAEVVASTPNSREDYAAASPMKRVAQADEVATAAIWLCSEGASYVTGILVPVEGGSTPVMTADKRCILVTGSSSGLGRATAMLFAEQGWRVVATMRNARAETVLARAGGVDLVELDTTDPERIIEVAADYGDQVDVVFNNAGYGIGDPLRRRGREGHVGGPAAGRRRGLHDRDGTALLRQRESVARKRHAPPSVGPQVKGVNARRRWRARGKSKPLAERPRHQRPLDDLGPPTGWVSSW
jgi:NAD(P)-dependent dehydrogenase (short-subunit alcohol dehydrogenase family)